MKMRSDGAGDLQHHLPPLGGARGIDLADAAEIEDDVALGAVGDLLAREGAVEIARQLQVGRAPVDRFFDLELARAGVGRVVEARREERGDVRRHRHRRVRLQEREEGERILVEVFGVAARLADALGQLAGLELLPVLRHLHQAAAIVVAVVAAIRARRS